MACRAGTGKRKISAIDLLSLVRDEGTPGGTVSAQWVTKASQESGFRVDCVNERGCIGLWQICPTNFGWLGTNETALRNDARLQYRMAKRIYERQGWDAWAASGGKPGGDASATSPRDLLAGAAALGETLPDPVTALVAPLAAIAGALKGFTEWLTDPDVWRRIALVAAGGGIVLVGAAALARGTEIGQTVEQIATTAATKGAVSSGGSSGGPMKQTKLSKGAK